MSDRENAGTSQSTREVVHLHFIGDVTDHGDLYECQRCGYLTGSDRTLKDHRSGLVTECDRMRLKQWVDQYA